MLISEFPTSEDVGSGRYFSGKARLHLEKLLKAVHLELDSCYTTSLVKCTTPKSRKPTKKAIQCCAPWLASELESVKPGRVFTFGPDAFKAFYKSKLSAYHGVKIDFGGFPPDNIRLLMEATNTLARLLWTRYNLSQHEAKGIKEGITDVLTELAVPLRVNLGSKIFD